MICERCQKKKAAVIHRDMRAGRLWVRHLCAECTEIMEATGELQDISAALPPYMAPLCEDGGGCFPFLLPSDKHVPTGRGQAKCPLCGLSEGELIATGRAGCSRCYATFADTLAGALLAMRGSASHKGRLPTAARERRERAIHLSTLREGLREAVAAEQYERAATLRDEIRALEAGGIA